MDMVVALSETMYEVIFC